MVDRRELQLGIIFTANVAQVTQALSQLRGRMVNMAGAQDKVGDSAKKAAAGQKQLGDQFTHVGKQLSRVHGGMERLMAAFKVVAAYGIAGTLTYGIINSLRGGTRAIFEFDQALYNLQAITNATQGEVAGMGKAIFKVAEETKFSAKEVGDGMVLLAQAGFTAAESMDAINAVAMLATGTLTDLKTSSDLLTTVIRAFGLEASDAMMVADVMASAINRSKLTVDKLRIAFNYLGPVADKAGLKIQETAAAAMLLANAGIRASTIGTGLRQVIARLVAPNERLREAFISAGVDLNKFTEGNLQMREVIQELVKIVPDAAKAFQLFGLRGAPAVSALTEAGVKGFDEMYEAVLRAGEATRMAETQMMGLQTMVKNLSDRLGTLAIRMGEGGIAGAFEVFIRGARELVKWLTELAENVYAQMFIGTATLTTVILGAGTAVIFLGYALSSVRAILAAFLLTGGKFIAFWRLFIEVMGGVRGSFLLLGMVIKFHPLMILVTVVSAIIASYKIWERHQRRLILNMETEERQATKNVAILEKYQKRLEGLTPGTAEYGAELELLAQQFPELEDSINRATHSLRDHGAAIEELKTKNAEEAVAKLVGQWAAYVKEMENLRRSEKLGDIEYGIEFAGLPEKTLDYGKSIEELSRKIETTVKRSGEVFWNAGYRANLNWSKLVDTLKKMVPEAGWRNIEAFASAVFKAVNDIEVAARKIKPAFEQAIADLPSYWKKKFDELNAVEQVAMVESLRTMNSRIAAMEKMASEMGLKEKQIAAARAAIHLESFEDFVDKYYKKTVAADVSRRELIKMEDEYFAYQISLAEKEKENIITRKNQKIWAASDAGKKIQDIERITAEAEIKAKEDIEKVDQRLLGLEAARLHVRRQRGAVDAKAVEDEKAKIELARAEAEKKYVTDEVTELEKAYEKELAWIKVRRDAEIKHYQDTGRDTTEVYKYWLAQKNNATEKFAADYNNLMADRFKDELEIEQILGKAKLEADKTKAIGSLDTRRDLKEKELELEEESLRKMLALTRDYLSLGIGDVKELKKEEARLTYELNSNLYDQSELQHDKYIKSLEKSSKGYIRYRQKMLREAGEQEIMVEREKWSIIKQYSDDWLEKLRAGLELARIDFALAARDYSTIIENMAQHMSAAVEEYFFQVMKGDLKSAHDAWKAFLDAVLREIARFIADQATAELLGLAVRMLGAFGGGMTPGTAGAGGSTYSTEAGLGKIALMHSGGQVGVDVFPRMNAPKWLLNLAPRLHSGLRPDEFPAILQRGETVTPRDEAAGAGNVNITIMTPDTRTMDEWVRKHRSLFAGATASSIREGDRQLVSSIKRVSRG